MASRAFITLELSNERVSYYRLAGSPEFYVPMLAHWVMDMAVAGTPLSSTAWLDWSGTAGTHAAEEWDARIGLPGDLEHEYVISSDGQSFRFVYRRRDIGAKNWRTVLDMLSVAELLAEGRAQAEILRKRVIAFRRRSGIADEAELPGIPTVSEASQELYRIVAAIETYDIVFAAGLPVIAPNPSKMPARQPDQDENSHLQELLDWCMKNAVISRDISDTFRLLGDLASAADVVACTRGLLLEAYRARAALARAA